MTTGITDILKLENDRIRVEIAPLIGGRITSIYNKQLNKEFLWHNESLNLKQNNPGDDYDTNFWGGIDELIPNDIPETIDGISYPDHGELWTTPLQYVYLNNKISVHGKLKLSGLYYKKVVHLSANSPVIYLDYTIKNKTKAKQNFLWKLHAALVIEEGDRLITSAQKGKSVYPETSRFSYVEEFKWPKIENSDVSLVSPKNNTLDFFYLYGIRQGEMKLVNDQANHLFRYTYDQEVFPYQWYFASYGGFLNHYTAILEPSTGMPVSVNEAMSLGQCAVLEPGQEIKTRVCIYAGENTNNF